MAVMVVRVVPVVAPFLQLSVLSYAQWQHLVAQAQQRFCEVFVSGKRLGSPCGVGQQVAYELVSMVMPAKMFCPLYAFGEFSGETDGQTTMNLSRGSSTMKSRKNSDAPFISG